MFSFDNFEKDGKKLKGVRLNVRGNGETYYIFIQPHLRQTLTGK